MTILFEKRRIGAAPALIARPSSARERIDMRERSACVVTRNGRIQRIDLADLRNGAEVHQALLAARERVLS